MGEGPPGGNMSSLDSDSYYNPCAISKTELLVGLHIFDQSRSIDSSWILDFEHDTECPRLPDFPWKYLVSTKIR